MLFLYIKISNRPYKLEFSSFTNLIKSTPLTLWLGKNEHMVTTYVDCEIQQLFR